MMLDDVEFGDTNNELQDNLFIAQSAAVNQRVDTGNLDLYMIQRAFEFTQKEDFRQADVNEIQCRLDALQGAWSEFTKNCRQNGDNDLHAHYAKGEEAYFATSGALRKRIAELSTTTNASQNASVPNVVQVHIGDALGTSKSPIFKGDFAEWANFRDWVVTSVQGNTKLTNADRLAKLLSAVEGTAKEAIGSWRYSDNESFENAWRMLKRRYDNDFQTIRAHLLKMHALKSLRKDSASDVELALNTAIHVQRELLLLVKPEQLSSYQFLFQLEQLLDADGRREWEMSRRMDALPTLQEMFDFLEQRRMLLTSLSGNPIPVPANAGASLDTRQVAKASTESAGAQPNNQSRRSGWQTSNRGRTSDRDGISCFKCTKTGHGLASCDDFKAMTLSERVKFVTGHRLCHGCYSPRHAADRCQSEGGRCRRCIGEIHNSTLCPQNAKIPMASKKEGAVANATGANPQ